MRPPVKNLLKIKGASVDSLAFPKEQRLPFAPENSPTMPCALGAHDRRNSVAFFDFFPLCPFSYALPIPQGTIDFFRGHLI
jgi:hypothetical protein